MQRRHMRANGKAVCDGVNLERVRNEDGASVWVRARADGWWTSGGGRGGSVRGAARRERVVRLRGGAWFGSACCRPCSVVGSALTFADKARAGAALVVTPGDAGHRAPRAGVPGPVGRLL